MAVKLKGWLRLEVQAPKMTGAGIGQPPSEDRTRNRLQLPLPLVFFFNRNRIKVLSASLEEPMT
jgi:hypothetical protein